MDDEKVRFLMGAPIYMDVCFWCRRVKDPDDTEGKPECFNYDPCSICEGHMDKGITVVQIEPASNGNPPIKDGLFPTGKWVVITETRIKKDFKEWTLLSEVLKTRHMYMNKPTWKSYGLPE